MKQKKFCYFDCFGGSADKFLHNQRPQSITFQSFKIRDVNSKICGTFCLYFFFLTERMDQNNAVLKSCFGKLKFKNFCVFFNTINPDKFFFIGNVTSSFVKTANPRTKYIESIMEEHLDRKNQFIKKTCHTQLALEKLFQNIILAKNLKIHQY